MRRHAQLFSHQTVARWKSLRLPDIRRPVNPSIKRLTNLRDRCRGIIFDQDAEAALCARGVSQECRRGVRGEPPSRTASRPATPFGTLEYSSAAYSSWN